MRVKLAAQANKFNVSNFHMYLSVFVIMEKVHFIISQGFARRKYHRFSFLDLGGESGEGGGEYVLKILIFLTSFFIFYTLKEDKR